MDTTWTDSLERARIVRYCAINADNPLWSSPQNIRLLLAHLCTSPVTGPPFGKSILLISAFPVMIEQVVSEDQTRVDMPLISCHARTVGNVWSGLPTTLCRHPVVCDEVTKASDGSPQSWTVCLTRAPRLQSKMVIVIRSKADNGRSRGNILFTLSQFSRM